MAFRILATQPERHRLTLPLADGRAIVVVDDGELAVDSGYAPGVAEVLTEAWEAHDYFYVSLVGEDGEELDGVSSMAGYGGPHKAAAAAAVDYFGVRLPRARRARARGGR